MSRLRAGCAALSLVASGLGAAGPVHACGGIEFGVGWINDAFAYGRYTAMPADRGYGVLQAHACRPRSPHDPLHASLVVIDLGTRSPQLAARVGRQGAWRMDLARHRLASSRSDAVTPMRDAGDARLSLPANWLAGPNTAALAALLPSLQAAELGSYRRSDRIGLAAWLPHDWQLHSEAREDRRHGLQPFAGLIGNTGGNPRAVLLPVPIDQRTRRYDVALVHAGRLQQWRIGYHASLFDQGIDAWRWDNPFSGVAGWHPAAGHPSGSGQAQPPPDNQFHQLSIATARDVSTTLRFNADVAIGRMRQDQPFLPYTINPALLESITEPLPRSALDGRIDTMLIQLRLTARPAGRWRWNAGLRFDERDNRTPSDAYVYVGGDSQAQDATDASSRRRFNLPPSDRRLQAHVDAGARVGSLRLQSGLSHETIERRFAARDRTAETRWSTALQADLGAQVSAGLRALMADRDGSSYIGSRPFAAGHAPAYVATVPGGFENLPELRQFHLADRRRHQLSLFTSVQPTPSLSLTAAFSTARDDYRRSELGLTATALRDLLLDASWHHSDGWRLHGFAGREWLDARQRGRSFSGGPTRLPQAADPDRNWVASHHDVVDTLGGGVVHDVAGRPWHWRVDYVRSLARGDVDVVAGPALPHAPLPRSRARLSRFDLGIERRIGDRDGLRLTLREERYRSRDWALDGVGPDTLANVILLGERSPDYRAAAVALAWRREF